MHMTGTFNRTIKVDRSHQRTHLHFKAERVKDDPVSNQSQGASVQ